MNDKWTLMAQDIKESQRAEGSHKSKNQKCHKQDLLKSSVIEIGEIKFVILKYDETAVWDPNTAQDVGFKKTNSRK